MDDRVSQPIVNHDQAIARVGVAALDRALEQQVSEQQRLLFDMFHYVFMVFDNLGWTRAGGPAKSLRWETVLSTYKGFSQQDILNILGPKDYADETRWQERNVWDLAPADFEPSQD